MYKLFLIYILFCIQNINAQELRQPLDIPLLLSGNFGELRSNHFHSGLDFKTQGVTGKPVYAVMDGYVSRISIGTWGFGYALYLNHPNGTTTVYGHVQDFSPAIAQYARNKQYEQESFNLNVFPEPDEIPVKKGELIAYSGNRGSSGGPHLHFELRDTKTEETIDAMKYFKNKITDNRPPKIHGILVCPMDGKGVVNGSNRKLALKPVTANGKLSLSGKIEAWGEIGLAIRANDYMDNTSNIYGVKDITLSLDGQVIYHSDLDRFAFDESRYINSYIDYQELKDKRSTYMRSYVEPGNRLRFIKSVNRGIVNIDKEKTYLLTYHLSDVFGNSTRLNIRITGKKQPVPEPETEQGELFNWSTENRFGASGIRLTVPKGNLYDDFYFNYSVIKNDSALADTHIVHDRPVPIHKAARLSLRILNDTLDNKKQYGIVRVRQGKRSWTGGSYRNGWIDADIREFGSYTVGQDTKAPTITPLNSNTWVSKRAIAFRLTDDLSGVDTYRGEIDGKYVLFEMDTRSVITYKFDKERLKRGKHKLKLTVADAAGNQADYTYSFNW